MKKTKKIIKNKEYAVAIAYYYTPDGDKDAVVFIVDKDDYLESQFKKYAKWAWGFTVKDEDIEGVYMCEEEEDCKGKSHKIKVIN